MWSQANGVWGPKRSLKACHGTATSQWFPEPKGLTWKHERQWCLQLNCKNIIFAAFHRLCFKNYGGQKDGKLCLAEVVCCPRVKQELLAAPWDPCHVASGSFAAAEHWGCGVSARHANHKIARTCPCNILFSVISKCCMNFLQMIINHLRSLQISFNDKALLLVYPLWHEEVSTWRGKHVLLGGFQSKNAKFFGSNDR